jgi:hypothetical protein
MRNLICKLQYIACIVGIALVVPILGMPRLLHAAPAAEIVEEACPPNGNCGAPRAGMRYLAFQKVLDARQRLSCYDNMLAVCNSTNYNDPIFQGEINSFRADVLDMALQAYCLIGPIEYSDNDIELMSAVQSSDLHFPHFQWPSSLQELVTSGLINHLPQSPYDSGRWLSATPTDGGVPGDVVYFAVPTKTKGYFLKDAGGLENFLFYIIGRPGVQVREQDNIQDSFLGDLKALLPVAPKNIAFLVGQLYPEDK